MDPAPALSLLSDAAATPLLLPRIEDPLIPDVLTPAKARGPGLVLMPRELADLQMAQWIHEQTGKVPSKTLKDLIQPSRRLMLLSVSTTKLQIIRTMFRSMPKAKTLLSKVGNRGSHDRITTISRLEQLAAPSSSSTLTREDCRKYINEFFEKGEYSAKALADAAGIKQAVLTFMRYQKYDSNLSDKAFDSAYNSIVPFINGDKPIHSFESKPTTITKEAVVVKGIEALRDLLSGGGAQGVIRRITIEF
jgi:hypothetical protein